MTLLNDTLMVWCSCPDRDVARELARLAVEQRLAACVNVIESVTSVYRWEGAIEEATEVLLLAKTRSDAFSKLCNCWTEAHPYELPEVVAVPITSGSEPYLQWIQQTVSPPA